MPAELCDDLGKHGLKLEARAEKEAHEADRLEPEVGKARLQAKADLEKAARRNRAAEDDARRAEERQKQIDAAEMETKRRQAPAQEKAAQRLAQIAALERQIEAMRDALDALRIRLTTELAEAARTTAAFMLAAATGQKAVPDTPNDAAHLADRPPDDAALHWLVAAISRAGGSPPPTERCGAMGELPVLAAYKLDRDPWKPDQREDAPTPPKP